MDKKEVKYTYLPISAVAEYFDVKRDTFYYFFNNNRDDAKTYLKVQYGGKDANGNPRKRYYVRSDFIPYYENKTDKDCTQEDITHYEKLYYQYIIKEEEEIRASGKSIATNEELWKDMELADAKLSRSCLRELRVRRERKPTAHERAKIADIVYRHIYGKRFFLVVCTDAVEGELAK